MLILPSVFTHILYVNFNLSRILVWKIWVVCGLGGPEAGKLEVESSNVQRIVALTCQLIADSKWREGRKV
jgi:hypothetical protein